MKYEFVDTEHKAMELVAKVKQEGYYSYYQKLNANTFEVRYWS